MIKVIQFNIIVGLVLILASGPASAEDNKRLLEVFHEYGITKCDSFILENSPLNSNWNVFIEKHSGELGGHVEEVTITRIFGSEGDTVKYVDTYIQTPQKCFLRTSWTLTFSGSCSENMDGNAWYVSTPMPNKDYTTYKNAGGVEVHAKEISLGNFKACIQEGYRRLSSNHR